MMINPHYLVAPVYNVFLVVTIVQSCCGHEQKIKLLKLLLFMFSNDRLVVPVTIVLRSSPGRARN